MVLGFLQEVEAFLEGQPWLAGAGVDAALGAAQQVRDQDVALGDGQPPTLRHGVARDRRISIEDPQMRHGRKSRSTLVDGYKRHVLRDLDSGLVRAVAVTAANLPEAAGAIQIAEDLTAQDATLAELHIDRAYLASVLVRDRPQDLEIFCKAWRVRNGPRFAKTDFTLDWDHQQLVCPAGQTMGFTPGGKVQFPANLCRACPLRDRCTTSPRGRSVQIHPDERLLEELRQRQLTAHGRARLRERVAVEHTLAQIGRWQGHRARYLGQRKNLFDLRRCAVVHNLHLIACQPHATQQAA